MYPLLYYRMMKHKSNLLKMLLRFTGHSEHGRVGGHPRRGGGPHAEVQAGPEQEGQLHVHARARLPHRQGLRRRRHRQQRVGLGGRHGELRRWVGRTHLLMRSHECLAGLIVTQYNPTNYRFPTRVNSFVGGVVRVAVYIFE